MVDLNQRKVDQIILMEHIGRQKWIFTIAYFLSWTFFF